MIKRFLIWLGFMQPINGAKAMNDFFVWSLQSAAPVVVVSDDGTAVEAVRAYLDTLDPIPDLSSELTVYATPRGEGPVTVFAVGIVETGTIG